MRKYGAVKANVQDLVVKAYKEGKSVREISESLDETRYAVRETLIKTKHIKPKSLDIISKEDLAEMVRLYEEEETPYRVIADIAGLTLAQVREALIYSGATTANHRQRSGYTTDSKLEVARLRANGATYQDIADKLNMSISTAHKFAKSVEVHPEDLAPRATPEQATSIATRLLNLDVENLPLDAQDIIVKMEGLLDKLDNILDHSTVSPNPIMTQNDMVDLLLNPDIE